MITDDIAAISTPPGEGGIAIVRLSGSGVIGKVEKIFEPFDTTVKLSNKKGYTLTLGWITNPDGEKIDEVLIGLMRGPKSYTGEDVVEINCHGGTLAAHKCLENVLRQGVRIAEPGEFTKRAFLNGRLDISQAEAVIEIIRAKTEKSLKLAMNQILGKTSLYIEKIEDRLIKLNAMVEASLDFPDEVGDISYYEAEQELKEILSGVEKILEAAERGEIYRDGVKVVICGKPNVGKSSLMNALARKEKAIVTSQPGTTRDIIEDYINIRGIPVKLIDTAGIRVTEDEVEKIGVEKSQEVIREADLVIFLLDMGTGITAEDLDVFQSIENQKKIVLVNKEDLEKKNITEEELGKMFSGVAVIRGSVKEEVGLDDLEATIERMILSGEVKDDQLDVMFNLRQKNLLLRARGHLQDAIKSLQVAPLDCLGVDIWGALESIGEIKGKNLKENVIDRIFHDFCIGK